MSFITTNDGVRIYYEDVGTGKPLLFIGGWTMSTPWWRKQVSALSSEYRTIAVDMRGYGQSDKPAKGHRIARYAKDVYNLINALELEDVTPVGWSMGVSTILCYLDLFGSHKLRGAVFVDQTPKILTDAEWKTGLGDNFTPEAAAAFAGNVRADHTAFATGLIGGMFVNAPGPEEQQWMLAEMLKAETEGAAKVLFDHCCQDWRDVLPSINIPLLIIAGKQSSLFPYQSSVYMSEQAPNATLMIFENSNHCPFYEEPERFNAAVAEFVR
jgi:pimeloyl-ACP methyl ester carboxylesterase